MAGTGSASADRAGVGADGAVVLGGRRWGVQVWLVRLVRLERVRVGRLSTRLAWCELGSFPLV